MAGRANRVALTVALVDRKGQTDILAAPASKIDRFDIVATSDANQVASVVRSWLRLPRSAPEPFGFCGNTNVKCHKVGKKRKSFQFMEAEASRQVLEDVRIQPASAAGSEEDDVFAEEDAPTADLPDAIAPELEDDQEEGHSDQESGSSIDLDQEREWWETRAKLSLTAAIAEGIKVAQVTRIRPLFLWLSLSSSINTAGGPCVCVCVYVCECLCGYVCSLRLAVWLRAFYV